MLEYVTAGESHGPALFAIVTGMPRGLRIDRAALDALLARRQGGYGRSNRQKIERDRARFLSGVRKGETTGNPITIRVANRANNLSKLPPVTRPRPGHADLAGVYKFGHESDARDVLERSSARETAVRTAVGGLAALLLGDLGISVFGHVRQVGTVRFRNSPLDAGVRAASPFYSLDPEADARAREAVDEAAQEGETLGGVVEVVACNVPPGLGSNGQSALRLDARLAAALMAVPAMKAVEIGDGFRAAGKRGSQVHDRIRTGKDGRLLRPTNRAGGLEGGMTNGEAVVVRASMKPLSTLRRRLESVDLESGGRSDAHFERSDITAVPAASVVCEAVTAFVLAQAAKEKFGGDSMEELRRNYEGYVSSLAPRWDPRAIR